jgi:hypothetical protein
MNRVSGHTSLICNFNKGVESWIDCASFGLGQMVLDLQVTSLIKGSSST